METTEIKVKLPESNIGLYGKYEGQINPQGCFIQFDPRDGELTADWNGEIGNAIPMDVWHGRVRRYPLPFAVFTSAVKRFVDDHMPLLQRIRDGFAEDWDGNNMVGILTVDAAKAEEELEQAIDKWFDEDDAVKVYEVSDWFANCSLDDLGINEDMSDEELQTIADNLRSEALSSGECNVLDGDVFNYLQNRLN